MKFYSLHSNDYRLDGGAMFGNAPKPVWEKWIAADERNRLPLATRAFLAVTQHHVVLVDAGIGGYMEPKLADRFGVYEPGQKLLESLGQRGFSSGDVSHVIMSHLHFDHVGGLLSAFEQGRDPELLFPNARFYTSESAWERAIHPVARDRASFIPVLNRQLEASGRLELLAPAASLHIDELDLHFFRSDGHTPGLLCSDLRWEGQRAVFASDLVPGRPWVHLPITMGYDRYPELLIQEKEELLTSIAADDAWLCYVHDPAAAVSKVRPDPENGSFVAVDELAEYALS